MPSSDHDRAAQGLSPTYEQQYGNPPPRPLLPQPVEWGGGLGKLLRLLDFARVVFATIVGALFIALGVWVLTVRAPGPRSTAFGLILFGVVLLALAYRHFKRLR